MSPTWFAEHIKLFGAIVTDRQAMGLCFITLYAWSITFIELLRDTLELRSYLERVSNQEFGTIIKLELVLELLSAIVKLKTPPAILLAWRS